MAYGEFYIVGTIWLVLSIESAVALRDWLSCATIHSLIICILVSVGARMNFRCFSPPVRWGLLDFMLAYSASSFSSSSSSSFFLVLLRLLRRRAAQCPVSAGNRHVQCQPATAIIGAQCSLPDLNRDHLHSVFPAGPRLRPKWFFTWSNPFEFKEMLEWHCIDVWPSRGSRKASRGPRRGTLLPSTLS